MPTLFGLVYAFLLHFMIKTVKLAEAYGDSTGTVPF